jgi:hypothetical protein
MSKLNTLGATRVLGMVGLLLLAAVSWLVVIGPSTAALGDVRARTTATRSQNESLALQLLSLKKQAAQLDRTRRTAQALAARFPPTADQPGVFQQVTAAATSAGISARDVTALSPTPPTIGSADAAGGVPAAGQGGGDLARQTVTVTVSGRLAEIGRLLRSLERMPRAYLTSSVTVGGGLEGGAYTVTVTGEMFVMPPAPDPATARSTSRTRTKAAAGDQQLAAP